MRGVVLDFDGVLARSMAQHAEAYRRTLRPFGIDVRDADVFRMEGARSESIIEEYLRKAGKPTEAALVRRLANEKQVTFQAIGPIALYDGAESLVRSVRRSFGRVGLVTGTRKENLERAMANLLPLFDALLAQDSYTHDKPHPEPYTNAAKALRLAPGDCAALENAVRGVQSAKAAGVAHVVGLTTTMARHELVEAGADEVAATHTEAGRMLSAWAARAHASTT